MKELDETSSSTLLWAEELLKAVRTASQPPSSPSWT